MQDVNRLKLVLVVQKKTSKWLSDEIFWVHIIRMVYNSSQFNLETIA